MINSAEEDDNIKLSQEGCEKAYSEDPRVCILVLGMHRSGTSAVTRCLSMLGAALPKNILGPGRGNEHGHFEPERLVTMNDRVLSELGQHWFDWDDFDWGRIDAREKVRIDQEWFALVNEEYSGHSPFIIKDPRLCKLADPFISAVAKSGALIHVFVVVRNPVDVIASLLARSDLPEGFDKTDAALLWLAHMLSGERAARSIPHAVISYEALMADPVLSLSRAVQSAGWHSVKTVQEMSSDIAQFIDIDSCHHATSPDALELDPQLAGWVAGTYSALRDLEAGSAVAAARRTLDRIYNEFSNALPFLRALSDARRVSMAENCDLNDKILELTRTAKEAETGLVEAVHAVNDRDAQIQNLTTTINEILCSTSWRFSSPVRWVGGVMRRFKLLSSLLSIALKRGGGLKNTLTKVFKLYRREGLSGVRHRVSGVLSYEMSWQNSHTQALIDPEEVARSIFSEQQAELTPELARSVIIELPHQPLISIIVPVYDTPIKWLRRMVGSLQAQFYTNWELCIVDDCSPTEEQRRVLTELSAKDPRIRLAVMPANGGISAASNLALDMAQGEFIALVDHDDEITPDALLRMVQAINADPEADFLYSDECKICDTPERRLFHFMLKPDWSPEIMLNFMLTGHLTVYRSALVREIGGFRSAYDFSQDYDLALRMAEVSRSVIHVERILYLWRAIRGSAASGGKDFARETNIAALSDALIRRQIPGTADIEPHANRVRIALPENGARVSIVIPSDSAKNLRLAVDAIREGTDYSDYEVRVVCNSDVAAELERDYRDWPVVKFVRYDKPFNFSDKCNAGAEAAQGDIIVFYNDDVFPIGRDWIERLIEYLWIPGVGATSPQLLYKDGTIQYAGMISGTPGMAGTAYHRLPVNSCDPFLSLNRMVRNVSIVSGACFAMRREIFLQLDGFDPVNTPDGHSDLDISYKVLEAGMRCVYTPYALLHHIGNHSWNATPRKYKADIFCLKRWGGYVSRDPYFTPSMCRVLYRDFVFDYRIYSEVIDPKRVYEGPDVLFVSHELSHTGAPHILFEAAKAVKAAGGFPVVVAPSDGPLRADLEREGITVIIDASMLMSHFLFERFARNFDLAVVNTSVLRVVVEQLAAIPTLETIWWIHESRDLSQNLKDLPVRFWNNVNVVCVSNYARRFLPECIPVRVLFNGLPDYSVSIKLPAKVKRDGKLTFLLMGTVEPRKGQDLFVDAIRRLPQAIRQDCNFVMVGKLSPGNVPFWEKIAALIDGHPEITYLGDMKHEDALAVISACDVLVASSRDDAFSLVCLEAMQFEKALIVSDCVGIAEVLSEDSSYIFPSGDSAALSECLKTAYELRDHLPIMGSAARKIYEEKLTDGIFAENFLTMVDELITPLDVRLGT